MPADAKEAARRLYDLALTFQERSQQTEARLIEQFEIAAQDLARVLGDQLILDDDDERLWFKRNGAFEAEVVPERDEDDEEEGQWVALLSPDELVQFYDPTDLFGDLAETLAEHYPGRRRDEDGEDAEVRPTRGRRRRCGSDAPGSDAATEPRPTRASRLSRVASLRRPDPSR